MKWCDAGIVSLPIGNDCSSEIGWFAGARKPVYVIIETLEEYDEIKGDWMVKGFLTGAIIKKSILKTILTDKILKIVDPTIIKEQFRYDYL